MTGIILFSHSTEVKFISQNFNTVKPHIKEPVNFDFRLKWFRILYNLTSHYTFYTLIGIVVTNMVLVSIYLNLKKLLRTCILGA
jgi:hypothetical protein